MKTHKYTTVLDLFRVVFLQFPDIISMSLAEKDSLESQKKLKYFFYGLCTQIFQIKTH